MRTRTITVEIAEAKSGKREMRIFLIEKGLHWGWKCLTSRWKKGNAVGREIRNGGGGGVGTKGCKEWNGLGKDKRWGLLDVLIPRILDRNRHKISLPTQLSFSFSNPNPTERPAKNRPLPPTEPLSTTPSPSLLHQNPVLCTTIRLTPIVSKKKKNANAHRHDMQSNQCHRSFKKKSLPL